MEFNGLTHYDPGAVDTSSDLILYDQNPAVFEDGNAGYQLTEEYVQGGEHYRDGEYTETQTILADGGDSYGVSSIAFDLQEELLWMGNQGGHVTSYYGPDLQKYTSFQVHSNQEVRYIHTFEEGILALTQTALRCQMRRGIPIYTYTSNNLKAMQCLMQITQTNILMGGHQPNIVNFDFNTSQETQLIDVGINGCAILRTHTRYICAADPAGNIKLLDPVTLQVQQNLETHTGSLSDFDIHGNMLVTCGFSQRQGTLSVDRFLMVYDLRMNRPLSPITVMLDPFLLRFLPSFSSRLSVVSAQGQMQLVDTMALNEDDLCLYQINTGLSPLSLDVSPSCQFLSVGDAGGQIHLFSSNSPNARFNSFSRDTEFPDPVEPQPAISFDDYTVPLSVVPMPYVAPSTVLASDWPDKFLAKVYRPTPPIDPDILRSMKMQGTIGYAPNPMIHKRNQVPYITDKRTSAKSKLFNSADGAGIRSGATDSDGNFVAIPKRYRKLEFKHNNKEDGDYDQFNKTKFCGLEAQLPNNYCNAMLQILYYLEPLRAVACGHLCPKEFCLCCELGFLFHMLDNATGTPCQASNFLRAFRTVPEASALGLILSDSNANLIRLIQSWNRFMIHQLHFEMLETRKREVVELDRRRNASESPRSRPGSSLKEKDFPSIMGHLHQRQQQGGSSERENVRSVRGKSDDDGLLEAVVEKEDVTEISGMFGMKQLQINRCLKCATDISKESTLLLCNLIYPNVESDREHSFCSVLANSLCHEQTTPAWCDRCDKFRPTLQLKRLKSLPHILTLNCGIDSQSDKDFWQNQMKIVIENVTKTSSTNSNVVGTAENKTEPGPKISGVQKLCRYGENCTRSNCRFKHPGQQIDKPQPAPAPSSNLSQLYFTHSWLPTHIKVELLEKGNVNITKLTNTDLESPIQQEHNEEVKQTVRYDLVGVVCHITENEEKKNLISFINVGPSYHKRKCFTNDRQWFIFNDFCVTPVPEQEVTWFSMEWKVPCVLYWINRDTPPHLTPDTVSNPITVDVFGEDKCLARDRGRKRMTFTPLGVDEMPRKGELVAMDAEFVSLNQEEAELRSDGKLSTIKPSHRSVARITCVRGQGVMEGTPFIDDYISTQEQVFDYLTKFSGIQPGDLDAYFSSKHLTTLKSTYQKLRFLVDNGVIFVGHGLKNDFRVINILVPPEQIIDTVYLFHLPHQRMISLKFLAWHFLGVKIQSVTHDSIEDARTALHLYHEYLKLKDEGILRESLEKLYETGKSLSWVVPDEEEDNSISWELNNEET